MSCCGSQRAGLRPEGGSLSRQSVTTGESAFARWSSVGFEYLGRGRLTVTDDTVITELAREKARRLGISLVGEGDSRPSSAPARPYISEVGSPASAPAAKSPPAASELEARVFAAVKAKLGDQVGLFAGLSLQRADPDDIPYVPECTATGGLNWRLAPGWFLSVNTIDVFDSPSGFASSFVMARKRV